MGATADRERRRADGAAEPGEERSLTEILDRLGEAGEERGESDGASLNDVLAEFEDRSLGVLVTAFGLIAAIPVIGAIPGISMATATLILLAVLQALSRKGGAMRLPGKLGNKAIDRDKLERGLERARPWTRRVDRLLSERLTALTRGRLRRGAIVVAVVVLALTMYPLAFVPWGVTPPAFGIVAFGLALIARDGLFALFGYLFCAGTALTFLWAAQAVWSGGGQAASGG
jgi:hypothetical protein